MKLNGRLVLGGLIAFFGLALAGAIALGSMDRAQAREDRTTASGQVKSMAEVRALIAGWPVESRLAAAVLLEKHGVPDSAAPGALIWRDRGNWMRIAAYRFPQWSESGVVEHSVRYEVPVESWELTDKVGLGVSYEPIGQVLSASSGSEASNILALNVAVDVFQGRKSVAEGREFYARIADLASSGKSSPYTAGLKFKPEPLRRVRQPGQLWPMP